MASGGPTQVANPSDYVITVPLGTSLSKEEIVAILTQVNAPKTVQNVTIKSGTHSEIVYLGTQGVTAPNISKKPLSSVDLIKSAYLNDLPKFSALAPNTNQVLTPISPNILTPEASPIATPTTPVSTGARSKNRFQRSNSDLSTPKTHAVSSASPHLIGWPNELLATPEPNELLATPEPAVQTKRQEVAKKVNLAGTLVFFDLETTGLGHMIGKCNVQITEISMIAFDRKEFWQSKNSDLKDIRIIQKLSMCVRPRSAVSPGAAKITGLDNYNLIDQCPFDQNAATAILSFLSHLPKPVCLLAHNGNTFDFPLLRAELKRISVHLPPEMKVADTLVAFKSIGIEESPPDRKVCKSVKYGRNGRLSHSLENLHLFFFNKKPTGSHSSEGDCIALAKVCHKLKEEVIPWIDDNAKTLEDFAPMW